MPSSLATGWESVKSGKPIRPIDVKYGVERLFTAFLVPGDARLQLRNSIAHPKKYAGPHKRCTSVLVNPQNVASGFGAEVGKTDKFTFGHLGEIVEVVNGAVGLRALAVVEIVAGIGIEAGVLVLGVTHTTVGNVALAGHVVDHGVHVDLHARVAAVGDHRLELFLIAHPAGQVVVDGLVDLPPRVNGAVRLGQ